MVIYCCCCYCFCLLVLILANQDTTHIRYVLVCSILPLNVMFASAQIHTANRVQQTEFQRHTTHTKYVLNSIKKIIIIIILIMVDPSDRQRWQFARTKRYTNGHMFQCPCPPDLCSPHTAKWLWIEWRVGGRYLVARFVVTHTTKGNYTSLSTRRDTFETRNCVGGFFGWISPFVLISFLSSAIILVFFCCWLSLQMPRWWYG